MEYLTKNQFHSDDLVDFGWIQLVKFDIRNNKCMINLCNARDEFIAHRKNRSGTTTFSISYFIQ